MNPWIAVAIACPLAAACSRSDPSETERPLNIAICATHPCYDLPRDRLHLPEGTVQVLDYDDPCKLAISWSVTDSGSDLFRVTLFAHERDLFPLRGHLVQLTDCRTSGRSGGRPHPPYANLLMDPSEGSWASLGSDGIFIPFHGEASMDQTFFARASRVVAEDSGSALSVRLSADDAHHASILYGHLRAGDTFAWGTHNAEVVRIVDEGEGLIGWVEVRVR